MTQIRSPRKVSFGVLIFCCILRNLPASSRVIFWSLDATRVTPHHRRKKIKFKELSKKYYLYDLFKWEEGDEHTHFEGDDNPQMYEEVKARFSAFDFVKVIRGSVPESFGDGFPEKIAFAHLDMNHPAPESGALKAVLPRLSKGGVVVLDDYGWWGYSAQKIALDPIIKEHGLTVLELPTGQALILK